MRHAIIAAAFLLAGFLQGCGSSTVDTGQRFDSSSATPERQVVFATRDGDVGVLKRFLDDYPSIVEELDSSGNTLLHHAAMASQVATAKLLIERGADVNALNWDDYTPLGAAADRNASPEMIGFLEEHGGTE